MKGVTAFTRDKRLERSCKTQRHDDGCRFGGIPTGMGYANQHKLSRLDRDGITPNSTGIVALMMLNIMEQYPLGEWSFHSTKALHVMIEAKNLAYADLIRYIGDPNFSKLPVETLLSKAHGAQKGIPEKLTSHINGLQTSKADPA